MVALLGGSGMIQPMIGNLAQSAQQVQQIVQPKIPGFSAADASLFKYADPNQLTAPTPTSYTPFFNSADSNTLASSFGDLSRNILAPSLAPSIQAPGVGGNPADRGFYQPSFAPPPTAPTSGASTPTPTTPQGSNGAVTSLGGNWAGVDQWNSDVQSAANATGLDPDWIKAVMKLESNGDPNASGAPGVWGPMQINSNAWGTGAWMSDPAANILKGAQILKQNLDQYGNMTDALRHYHGIGSDGYTTDQQYADIVTGNYNQLKSTAPSANPQNLPVTTPDRVTGDNPAGLNVLNVALSYVGKAPYVWGGIPGKGQDPSQTGWDCSGMTYWLDQSFGTGQLPMGSHYQYQYAQQTGKLDTNINDLQAGDLIFIDTGWMGGAGSEMNRAGHVAVYLGNGKIVQAANPDSGTIVSDLSSYTNGQYGTFLGGMHMSWSSGVAGGLGSTTGASAPASGVSSNLSGILANIARGWN